MAVPFLQSNLLLSVPGVSHGFFSRLGGVSTGDFSSLNCSQFSGDDLDCVKQNRHRVVAQLGGKVMVTNHQVHGNKVRVVGEGDDSEGVVDADGLVTRSRSICIGAQGADCAPVLFADEFARVVGVAHAGWQGALGGITDAVVDTMCENGASIESLYCAIGPAIQRNSYEVGQAFKDNFLSRSPIRTEGCFSPDQNSGNQHFDLPGYIELRLKARGLTRIDRFINDTYQDHYQFFSYRRSCHQGEMHYGRQISAICLI